MSRRAVEEFTTFGHGTIVDNRTDPVSEKRLRLAAEHAPQEPPQDPRVAAVLAVLGGSPTGAVASQYGVEPALLRRWVRAFVDAGTAQVTNTPDPEAANQRDRFLTAFAHELRTPLAVAQGWVDVLAEGDLPPSMAESTVGRLGEALERLAERVVDVELLAASSLGRVRLTPAAVSLGDLVEELDVALAPGCDPGTVLHVDVDLFRRVLRDLVLAAAGAPAPRSLSLEVRAVAPWVELRVLREGDPIDTGVLQALFEPFDVNDDATGVTIGLYLARALTVAHGGTLGLEQDDHGAVLWVRVPAVAAGVDEKNDTTELRRIT